MGKDKKDYEETLVALTARGALTSIVNKVRKVALMTEDEQLRRLLAPIVNRLDEAIRNQGKVKGQGLNLADPSFKPVMDYCNAAIASAKPQWQIIAERHGWRPPATPPT